MLAENITMSHANAVHAIILTYNEEQHIARCMASLLPLCQSILVIDSGSTDNTAVIARYLGAEVLVRPFTSHADQVNAAIDYLDGRKGWLLRLDADEYLMEGAGAAIREAIETKPDGVAGLLLRRRIIFMGRWMRWGGAYPVWILRLWRNGQGRCEQRWMDEHIRVGGKTGYVDADFADENLKPVGWWTEKHNAYASREAIEVLDRKYRLRRPADDRAERLHGPAARKRWIKENIYNRLPGALRAQLYFVLRYIFMLGFLDGRQGYFFHVLQAFWYRTLVDAKVAEIEGLVAGDRSRVRDAIKRCTGIAI